RNLLVAEPDNLAVANAPRHHVSAREILRGRVLLLRPFAEVFRMPDLNLRRIVSSLGRRCVFGLTCRYAEEQSVTVFGPLWCRVRSHSHVFWESAVYTEIVVEAGWTGRRDALPRQDCVA